MPRRKNNTTLLILSAALGITVLAIAYLLWARKKTPSSSPQHNPTQLQSSQPQPKPSQSPQEHSTVVGGSKPALVLFHMNGCGHCTAMKPAWDQIKQILASTGQIDTYDLEATSQREEVQKHGVQGFPTIRLYPQGFPNQNFIQYKGNRSVESMMKFVKSMGKEF